VTRPTVAAVMLVDGREAMARRAVECVRAQKYANLFLAILDTTPGGLDYIPAEALIYRRDELLNGATIGELRNALNVYLLHTDADIIVHFDSDDYSHPRRVAEQVALLEASGADAVGYNEALFLRSPRGRESGLSPKGCDMASHGPDILDGEAWIYANADPRFCLGASLAYWRRVWARKPFAATSQGEDFRFCLGLRTVGVSSLYGEPPFTKHDPRFVARIHAGNTSNAYGAIEHASEWRRAPEWDAYCRERMAL
jgi:glycosyltransferase involved in cell wall biosynthesis